MRAKTKKAIKATFSYATPVAMFLIRNWKIVTTAVALISTSAAAIMGKLTPVADAISQAVPL